MEGCYSSQIGYEEAEVNCKIVKHPTHQTRTSPWFNLGVFYVRFRGFSVDDSTPDYLTLKRIPLSPDTDIEVNDQRTSIHSHYVSSLLRRDRVDKKIGEATFVSTDSIRITGSVRFEVYGKVHLLLSGALELCDTICFVGEVKSHCKKWNISCEQEMSAGAVFSKGRQQIMLPTVDVCVTGSFSGSPIILTKTFQLGFEKKHHLKASVDLIPECEATELKKDALPEPTELKKDVPSKNLQVTDDFSFYHLENCMMDDEYDALYSRMKYLEGEGEELSMFNAGVRMGVGIGLGVCLGVGVGIGLLMRTCQATTGSFKRRLI